MLGVHGESINQLYNQGVQFIHEQGVQEQSRNGPVLVFPAPFITVWNCPWQRVLINKHRRANPFFHVMEAMWMLAGRNDVEFVAQFVKRMREFSDDGETFHGAYGYRWCRHFGYNQIWNTIIELTNNPQSRRCVIAMWDSRVDRADANTKDLPCNTQLMFRVNNGQLDMTVLNRSNDLIWGLYGANAVHMSFLMEFIAAAIQVPMGTMYTWSNNCHMYTEHFDIISLINGTEDYNYPAPAFLVPLIGRDELPVGVYQAIEEFVESPAAGASSGSNFIRGVAYPMYRAWLNRDNVKLSTSYAHTIQDKAWQDASLQWLGGRK